MARDYQGDWARIARLIVHDSLKVQPGETVLIHTDPTYFPELTEQVRIEVVRAGAIEVCTMELMPPALDFARRQLRLQDDAARRTAEDQVLGKIFELADVYIWLPNDWPHIVLQTEDIIRAGWKGRSIHFHWVPAWWPPSVDQTLFRYLSAMYEEALFIDYQELTRRQDRIMAALTAGRVHITTPGGTDLSFDLTGAHFHQNNGDASKGFVNAHAREGSARDREEELPAGVLRTVDIKETRGTLVVPNETYPAWTGRHVGALKFEFDDNSITSFGSESHSAYTQAMWSLETGEKDHIGEFVLGCNPALKPVPGHQNDGVVSYFGFGEGIVRFSMGYNLESGGCYDSSFLHNWLYLTDATVTAGDTVIVKDGALVMP